RPRSNHAGTTADPLARPPIATHSGNPGASLRHVPADPSVAERPRSLAHDPPAVRIDPVSARSPPTSYRDAATHGGRLSRPCTRTSRPGVPSRPPCAGTGHPDIAPATGRAPRSHDGTARTAGGGGGPRRSPSGDSPATPDLRALHRREHPLLHLRILRLQRTREDVGETVHTGAALGILAALHGSQHRARRGNPNRGRHARPHHLPQDRKSTRLHSS